MGCGGQLSNIETCLVIVSAWKKMIATYASSLLSPFQMSLSPRHWDLPRLSCLLGSRYLCASQLVSGIASQRLFCIAMNSCVAAKSVLIKQFVLYHSDSSARQPVCGNSFRAKSPQQPPCSDLSYRPPNSNLPQVICSQACSACNRGIISISPMVADIFNSPKGAREVIYFG